jgi:hypothetical protein
MLIIFCTQLQQIPRSFHIIKVGMQVS